MQAIDWETFKAIEKHCFFRMFFSIASEME